MYVRVFSSTTKAISHDGWVNSYVACENTPGNGNDYVLMNCEDAVGTVYLNDAELRGAADIGWDFYHSAERVEEFLKSSTVALDNALGVCAEIDATAVFNDRTRRRLWEGYFSAYTSLIAFYKISAEEFTTRLAASIVHAMKSTPGLRDMSLADVISGPSDALGTFRERVEWANTLRGIRECDTALSVRQALERHRKQFGFLGARSGTPDGWSLDFLEDRLRAERSRGVGDAIAAYEAQFEQARIAADVAREKRHRLAAVLGNSVVLDTLSALSTHRLVMREELGRVAQLSNRLFQDLFACLRREWGELDDTVLRQCGIVEVRDWLEGRLLRDTLESKRKAFAIEKSRETFRYSLGSTRRVSEGLASAGDGRRHFQGTTVSGAGCARGIAYLIPGHLTTTEKMTLARQMPSGNILVTAMTHPNFMLAAEKASAILTDHGGMLCHAAIVARELRKPCIVGLVDLSAVVASGDALVIDYEAGSVTVSGSTLSPVAAGEVNESHAAF